MFICIVFVFQLIIAKEVWIDIEVKTSEEKWCEVMASDVSSLAVSHDSLIDNNILPNTFIDIDVDIFQNPL